MLSLAVQNTNKPIRIRNYVARNPKVGVDFIPPLNAKAEIQVKTQTLEQKQEALRNWTEFTSADLPAKFSWKSSKDIKKYHGFTPRGNLLSFPVNQWSCGCCWAISSATMHADRTAIWTQSQNTPLSAGFIMACMSDSLGCDGGFPSSAGDFLESHGTVEEKCWPYSWCSNSAECRSGTGNNNDLLPKCTGSCRSTGSTKRFKAIPNSVIAIIDPESIQLEILRYGPVVAVFRVFADFLLGKPKDAWRRTNNIYVHIPNKKIYETDKNADINNICGTREPNQCYMGNHAVVIVGWGTEKLKTPLELNGQIITELKYWIVRNSWGSSWNGDGYFNVAFSDPNTGINMSLAMDRPLRINGKQFGAVTTWFPDVEIKGPLKKSVLNSIKSTFSKTTTKKYSMAMIVVIATLAFILLLLVIGIFYFIRNP